jgi:hypothetical protein
MSLVKQTPTVDDPGDMNGDELMDINSVTLNFEFHGSTSVVALFNGLRKVREGSSSSPEHKPEPIQYAQQQRSVVGDFHNESFPGYYGNIDEPTDVLNEENYSLHALLFIDAYFKSLHFVHPVLEQGWFLERCNCLWAGRIQKLRRSFMALYFSVLCLGACIRTWTEESINGMTRLDWVCLLFRKAERALGRSGSVNDLEAVQAPFILCQVCLHQMDLNLAYAFLGMAIRTAFSTGINRKVTFADRDFPQDSPLLSVSRTWWALHNLEIELSFTLGRPNGLGLDRYHNRPLPPIDVSENAIIPATYKLSSIMRRVSTEIYLSRARPSEKLQQATDLENELEQWLSNLPEGIRPLSESAECSVADNSAFRIGPIRGPHYQQLQKFILRIRKSNLTPGRQILTYTGFLHVKIILFYLFFIKKEKIIAKESLPEEQLHSAVEKCRTAARSMIRILYWTYRMHHSFHTWSVASSS